MERYIVYKIFRKSGRKRTIETGLTREDAQKLVQSYPDSNTSMVVFDKM